MMPGAARAVFCEADLRKRSFPEWIETQVVFPGLQEAGKRLLSVRHFRDKIDTAESSSRTIGTRTLTRWCHYSPERAPSTITPPICEDPPPGQGGGIWGALFDVFPDLTDEVTATLGAPMERP